MGKIGEYLQCGKCNSSIEYAPQCPHQLLYLGMEEQGSNAYCEISYCETFIQQSPLLLGNRHVIKDAEQTRH